MISVNDMILPFTSSVTFGSFSYLLFLFSLHSFVRFLLLVLEQSRVEVAVWLNELAYLKYEASKNCSSTADSILLKQRNLAIAFSLMEKIIKLISDTVGNEGT